MGVTTITGLVLAAGGGRRFGGPKALARLHGSPLAQRAVALMREGGCEDIYIVLGAQASRVVETVDLGDAVVVDNPDWESGIGSSLRAGLAALPPAAAAAVVVLVDQPLIGAEAIRRVIQAHLTGAAIAVATYGGQFGHPVLLSRPTWAGVAQLAQGDTGARAYLRTHPEQVIEVACDETGSPADVDTPDDLAALQQKH
ncbi:4-diphosphocytidyl-2C-methyl-D-erythritol synthase [Rhizocola hellebori]|uniref:4-diphosphocytidyl-2C-methyl-D-erythritol synthase n=1 Tax=Rhizocola hellebori TaxID=1392758 RepID=A0A8J3QAK1_9ACTN|nr:nucleotidyltransferase family protein [Rhizocola hellebori]GIH06976.1 4-diphosphocytidyl-2C-methyl-D-erythritol synthase [Rhizocola hellebori]